MLDRINQVVEAGIEPALEAPMDPRFSAFRGAFGGWTAALAFLAARTLAAEEFVPSSLSIDFIGAIGPGAVRAAPAVVGTTRTTRFVRVLTTQAGRPCASSSVIFSMRRATQPIDAAVMPPCASPAGLERWSSQAGPNTWVERFDLRFAAGTPFTPNAGLRSLIWTRLDDTSPDPYATLAAMADASFPRIFFHFAEATPIATLTMSVHFHADAAHTRDAVRQHVLVEASGSVARHGFFDQSVRLWSIDGALLATSTQLVRYDVAIAA